MAALPKKLQPRSSCTQQLQQPTPFYGYKEFELQPGLLGPKAVQILFSD